MFSSLRRTRCAKALSLIRQLSWPSNPPLVVTESFTDLLAPDWRAWNRQTRREPNESFKAEVVGRH